MEYKVVKIRVVEDFFINYTYIVYNEKKEGIIIDPAWNLEKINNEIESKHIKLRAILVTHEHPDHINLVSTISDMYQIPIYLSKEINKNIFSDLEKMRIKYLENEKELNISSLIVVPIFTPGHTKSSISYLIGSNLFTGDTLFIEGCGMCTDPSSNPNDLFDSIQKIVNNIDLTTKIYPGHRYNSELGKRLSEVFDHNIYLHIKNRTEFVDFRMREGQQNLMDWI